MPLELISFQAIQIAQHAEIRWTAIHDPTALWVILEHSTDRDKWSRIMEWQPDGPEFDQGTYTHRNIAAGIHLYRLLTGYVDGTTDYSPIVPLRIRHDIDKVTIWPNPAEDKIEVFVQLVDEMAEIEYLIMDLQGRILLSTTGSQHRIIDISALEGGVYFLHMPATGMTQRFMIGY